MDCDKLRDSTLAEKRPDGFELCSIRQIHSYFDRRVRLSTWPLAKQLAIEKAIHGLPLHDNSFFESLGSVGFNYNLICRE